MNNTIYVVYNIMDYVDNYPVCYFDDPNDAKKYCDDVSSKCGRELYFECVPMGNLDVTSKVYFICRGVIHHDGTLDCIEFCSDEEYTKLDSYIGYNEYGELVFYTYIPKSKCVCCETEDDIIYETDDLEKAVRDSWEKYKVKNPDWRKCFE